MACSFNRSQLRLPTFPGPIQQHTDDLIEWGSCGLLALGARSSVLLYKATPAQFIFSRVIEIPDRRDPVMLRFHETLPILAVLDSCRQIRAFDCSVGEYLGTATLSEGVSCFDIKWHENVLVVLTSAGNLLGIDVLSNDSDVRLLWKADLGVGYTRIAIDHYSDFRVLVYSSEMNDVVILEGEKSPERMDKQAITGGKVVDACFHPHLHDMVMILLDNGLIIMEIRMKELRTVFSAPANTMRRLMPSFSNHREVVLMSNDNVFAVCRAKNGLEYQHVGTSSQIRRDTQGKVLKVSLSFNSHFRDYFVCYTQSVGLLMFKTHKTTPIILQNCQMIPRHVRSFEFLDGVTTFGLESGRVFLVSNIDGSVAGVYEVSDKPVSSVRFITKTRIIWTSENSSGIIDTERHAVIKLDSRAGRSLMSSLSNEISITKRGNFTIGLMNVDESKETFLSFNHEIIAIAAQWKQCGSTIKKLESDLPAYVVLLSNKQVHFLTGKQETPRLRFRCSDDLTRPIGIAWKQNLLITADFNGKLLFYDFDYKESKTVQCPFWKLRSVEFERNGTGLFIHSAENKLAYYTKDFDICPIPVVDFAVTGGGLVLIRTLSGSIELVSLKDWTPVAKIAHVPILQRKNQQILDVINHSDNIDSCIISCRDNGFVNMSRLMEVVRRFLQGSQDILPVSLGMFGGREEAINAFAYQADFMKGTLKDSCCLFYALFLKVVLKDYEGARHALLGFQSSGELFPVCALAAALMGSALDATSTGILKGAAISLFENGDIYSGALLLCIGGSYGTAAEQLQEHGMWDDSVYLLKAYPEADTDKRLLRCAAQHFLEEGKDYKAMMLFASIGDFHPVLAILFRMKNKLLAFLFMKVVEGTGFLREHDDMRFKFDSLDSIKNLVQSKYDRMVSSE